MKSLILLINYYFSEKIIYMNSNILVPTDFSNASNKALEHAIYLADKSGAKIVLINFCKENNLGNSKTQLEDQSNLFEHKCAIECLVRVGSYKNIPTVAKELTAEVIFLGTHGAKGIQKVLGSNALKVVTKSNIPYVVVQEDSPKPNGYKRILAPTSFHFESKQKIVSIAKIADHFSSNVTFIYSEKDASMKAKSLQNLKGMKQFLSKNSISSDEIISSGKNFNSDTLEACANNSIDMIAIMNMQKDDLLGTGLLGKNYEQDLIVNNLNIPVLIISPNNTRLFGSTINIFNA